MDFSWCIRFGVITVLLFCLAFYNPTYKTVTAKQINEYVQDISVKIVLALKLLLGDSMLV